MPAIKPIHYRKLMTVVEHEGFTLARQSGDHLIYTKPGVKRPLVLPMYDPVPVFIVRNLLRTAGINRDRYFELLQH